MRNHFLQTQKSPHKNAGFLQDGALGRIRTSDHLVRSQVLYPAELRAHYSFIKLNV